MCIVVVVGNWRGITALLAAVAWLGKKKTFPFSAPLCFQMQREHPRRRLRRHVHVGQGHGAAQELYRLLSKFESASSQEVFRHQLTNTKSTVSSPIKKQKRFRFVCRLCCLYSWSGMLQNTFLKLTQEKNGTPSSENHTPDCVGSTHLRISWHTFELSLKLKDFRPFCCAANSCLEFLMIFLVKYHTRRYDSSRQECPKDLTALLWDVFTYW